MITPGTWNYVFSTAAQQVVRNDSDKLITTLDLLRAIRNNKDLVSLAINSRQIATIEDRKLKKRANTTMRRLILKFKVVVRVKPGLYRWVGQ